MLKTEQSWDVGMKMALPPAWLVKLRLGTLGKSLEGIAVWQLGTDDEVLL